LKAVADDDTAPRSPAAIELHIVVRTGEPLTGTVRIDGGHAARPFHGWLALIAIINAARGRPEAR